MAAQAKPQAKKTQAKKAQAKKAGARKPAPVTKKATHVAEEAAKPVERTLRTVVTDGAYAALGVSDSAVAALKGVPRNLERIRKEAPKTLETGVKDVERWMRGLWTDTPDEVRDRLEAARKEAGEDFDGYAERGRTMARSVRRSAATRRALEQSRTARSQVKAAATSVRKAFGQGVEAVESAAEKVGEERRAG